MDEVEDVDFHVLQPSASISVEMPRHFSFLHIVHHLVEVAHILFLASSAGDTVDQVVAVARHYVFSALFSTCDSGQNKAVCVQQGTISALPVRASLVGRFGRFSLLRDGVSFDLTSRLRRFFGLRQPTCRPVSCMCRVLFERSRRSQVL